MSEQRPAARAPSERWGPPIADPQPTLGHVIVVYAALLAFRFAERISDDDPLAFVAVIALIAGAWFVATQPKRRRRRVVTALAAGGQALWDADWTGPRDVFTSRRRLGPIPRWLFVLFVLGGSFVGYRAFERASVGQWTDALVWAAPALAGIPAAALWLEFRGGVQAQLEAFPVLVGGPATFWVATTPGAPRLEKTEVTLRCVACPVCRVCRERHHLTTHWSATWRPDAAEEPGPDEFVAARFDIPGDLPGTALHDAKLVRWELVVAGRTRWGEVRETLCVPVYAAPASPAAA